MAFTQLAGSSNSVNSKIIDDFSPAHVETQAEFIIGFHAAIRPTNGEGTLLLLATADEVDKATEKLLKLFDCLGVGKLPLCVKERSSLGNGQATRIP